MGLFFHGMNDFLADFQNHVGYSSDRNPYNDLIYVGFDHKQQPPLAYLFFYVFSRFCIKTGIYNQQGYFLTMYTEHLFLYMLILFYVISLIALYEIIRTNKTGSNLVKNGIAISILLSAPVLNTIERGNHTIITCIFFCIFVFWYENENKIIREIAIISLAIAAGLKLSPAFGGILLLTGKKWKESFRCMLYGTVLLIIPLLAFDGGMVNLVYFVRNLKMSSVMHSVLEGNSSSACIYSFLAGLLNINADATKMYSFFVVLNYLLCIILLLGVMVFPKKWQKILAISLVIISIQGHAGSYCFLYLIPSMVMFLNEEQHKKMEFIILFAFLCIMIPYKYRICGFIVNSNNGILILLSFLLVLFGKNIYQIMVKKHESKG